MTIEQLVSVLNNVEVKGDVNKEIEFITHDSRRVRKNTLFVCICGTRVDGNKFIPQAIEAGACAIMTEKDVEVPADITVIKVPNMREAMELAVPYFYDYPGKKMRMIGVTGTNGKTSSTYMLRDILCKAGYKVGVIGTIKIMIEDEEMPIHNTTPDVIDLQEILDKMYKQNIDYVVMEVSSHALDMNRIAGCEYDTAMFTNLTQDHLDYHKTMENYALAKAKLFDSLSAPNLVKSNKNAVINLDDELGSKTMIEHTKCNLITYGIKNDAVLKAENVEIKASGASFDVKYKDDCVHFDLKVIGMFNVYNILGVIGVALAEKISFDIIKETLEAFEAVAGRFELVRQGQDFSVIVDYAHTPDGLENVLKTAREIAKKRLIVVFGCGGDRDRTKRPIMGRIAAQLADVVIATSDNPRTEDPEFILSEVEAGVLPALHGNFHEKITDRRTAIFRAIELAQKDDIVLIAGKGHENYQILKTGTIHFDDKEVAIEAIRGKING
ncbi:MAG: UDP-N-acetylmuramoyl-L-alanyl-D-glutamate--2,6-diaminopimelate ligase [Megamonas funiformis]|uniref:UDP-N-acetylmuramoyl-L-alanyl-D-glutamate--2, 6-diaminopimelate ligase n=1 Tax=Megamonas funiformis TaxID=437897 RepID=UPI003990D463